MFVLSISLLNMAEQHILQTLSWYNYCSFIHVYIFKIPVVNNPLFSITKVFAKKVWSDIVLAPLKREEELWYFNQTKKVMHIHTQC